MAASRKLQSEIQQVLKKVEEGVQIFDDIWGKVYSAAGQNLKEKYEGDLKKEIKKLQRLRDQIKTWISSADVKDKSPLTEARKTIETKMEQFKICEKDTKTKAYSKEGLARADKLDPKEAEKEERRVWINEAIEKLSDIINGLEADVEKLSTGKTSKKTKDTIALIENRVHKNQWHTQKLELILRKIDADELDPTEVDAVKDDVEYYVESAVEDDGAVGIEDEFDIYEDLRLDENGDGEDEATAAPAAKVEEEVVRPAPKAAPTVGGIGSIGLAIGTKAAKTSTAPLSVVSPVKGVKAVGPGTKATSSTPVPTAKDIAKPSAPTPAVQPVAPTPTGATTWASAAQQKAPAPGSGPSQAQTLAAQQASIGAQRSSASTPIKVGAPPATGASNTAFPDLPSAAPAPVPPQQAANQQQATNQQQQHQQQQQRAPVHPDHVMAAHLLSQSMVHSPESADGDAQAGYTPRNPYATHPSFPQTPLTSAECTPLFERLPADSLFFAFYHQQESYQQYLAARQLKKQSWRFHKKYMTWFQRHEEPKVKQDDYEEGTYAFFDYEGGWCTRFRSDFKFEFAYLEDELPTAL